MPTINLTTEECTLLRIVCEVELALNEGQALWPGIVELTDKWGCVRPEKQDMRPLVKKLIKADDGMSIHDEDVGA